MTIEEFAEYQQQLIHEIYRLREAGQKEYAHDKQNAFRNFDYLAERLDLNRKEVLWVYLQKHLDGIIAHINGHRSQREHVSGRIKDAIVYLTLLGAMIEEEEEK